jgi:hypothetical protein
MRIFNGMSLDKQKKTVAALPDIQSSVFHEQYEFIAQGQPKNVLANFLLNTICKSLFSIYDGCPNEHKKIATSIIIAMLSAILTYEKATSYINPLAQIQETTYTLLNPPPIDEDGGEDVGEEDGTAGDVDGDHDARTVDIEKSTKSSDQANGDIKDEDNNTDIILDFNDMDIEQDETVDNLEF